MYFNHKKNITFNNSLLKQSISLLLLSSALTLSGCQTIKGLTGNDKESIESAENTAEGYYKEALEALGKNNLNYASVNLKDLRTFYPSSKYAEQALLDLMYADFELGNYEEAAANAKQFIQLYPSNSQVDYAYYVMGVANMAGTGGNLFKINRAERDTAYYRLAFDNFAQLVSKFPNSQYAPDAAQRMTHIYNQFAEHEIHVAQWYIKREAYVAAANRAKWVFQYYPQSTSVPESIATLAYSYEKLGMTDLSQEYKTLLRINYPQYLTANGSVNLDKSSKSIINSLTFGKLDKPSDFVSQTSPSSPAITPSYGQTKTQVIRSAQLRLPPQ